MRNEIIIVIALVITGFILLTYCNLPPSETGGVTSNITLITPTDGATDINSSSVLIEWTGDDPSYDLYLGETNPPPFYATINGNSTTVTLDESKTYYWNVEEHYISIYDWEDLANVDLFSNYILMNDLDSTTAGYDTYASSTANNGKGWIPIAPVITNGATYTTQYLLFDGVYQGIFDGNGHTISDFYIYDESPEQYSGYGLFGSIGYQGVVINLGVTNAYIEINESTLPYRIGALSGRIYGKTINCYTKDCTLKGYTGVGGFVGFTYNDDLYLEIDKCWSINNIIEGVENIGGFSGKSNQESIITNCYTKDCTIYADDYFGGFIGYIGDETEWYNCYASNTLVTPINQDSYAFNNRVSSLYTVTGNYNYFDNTTRPNPSEQIATGKSTNDMKQISTYTNWDIAEKDNHQNEIWEIEEGISYPYIYPYIEPRPSGGLSPWSFTTAEGDSNQHGDFNGNGQVNAYDVYYLANIVLGSDGFSTTENTDVNNNGATNAYDVYYFAMHILDPTNPNWTLYPID